MLNPNDLTEHHLLFPRTFWQYSKRAAEFRLRFTVFLPRQLHADFHEWAERALGVIPPIPPKELELIHILLDREKRAPKPTLSEFIAATRIVAADRDSATIRIGMTLTENNLLLQAQYLGLNPAEIHKKTTPSNGSPP